MSDIRKGYVRRLKRRKKRLEGRYAKLSAAKSSEKRNKHKKMNKVDDKLTITKVELGVNLAEKSSSKKDPYSNK